MEVLDPFCAAVNDPFQYADNWKKRYQRKIIGYFCSYTPEEIIYAGGMLPFRIFGSGRQTTRANAHLQVYCCDFVKDALGDALSGRLDFLDGAAFPHTCDSIQRLSDIWRLNTGLDFHADIVLPVRLETESARNYMVKVFQRFRHELEKETGAEISAGKLQNAIKTYNVLRGYLRKIYGLRSENRCGISSRDIQVIAKAAMIMDRDEFIENIPAVIQALTHRHNNRSDAEKRLVVTGGMCNFPDISSIIEAAGGVVVGDDLCTGSRCFAGTLEPGKDGIESIARRYWERMICPAKHAGLMKRGDHVIQLVRENQARGVIFVLLKYCDPQAFDYPHLKSRLDKAGIPSLLLEIEGRQVASEQLKTRCEIFVDIL